jgi:hypothetical protein
MQKRACSLTPPSMRATFRRCLTKPTARAWACRGSSSSHVMAFPPRSFPGEAHVGQRRARHPRATCRHAAGPQRALYEYRCLSRQRVPGAARHSGHHSASHARRSLTAGPPLSAAAGGHRFSGATRLPVVCGRERQALRYTADPWWPPGVFATTASMSPPPRRGLCLKGPRSVSSDPDAPLVHPKTRLGSPP